MSVAERLGPKSATISDLAIDPTAAYLLARPSVPDDVIQRTRARAAAGEKITTAVGS